MWSLYQLYGNSEALQKGVQTWRPNTVLWSLYELYVLPCRRRALTAADRRAGRHVLPAAQHHVDQPYSAMANVGVKRKPRQLQIVTPEEELENLKNEVSHYEDAGPWRQGDKDVQCCRL